MYTCVSMYVLHICICNTYVYSVYTCILKYTCEYVSVRVYVRLSFVLVSKSKKKLYSSNVFQ